MVSADTVEEAADDLEDLLDEAYDMRFCLNRFDAHCRCASMMAMLLPLLLVSSLVSSGTASTLTAHRPARRLAEHYDRAGDAERALRHVHSALHAWSEFRDKHVLDGFKVRSVQRV